MRKYLLLLLLLFALPAWAADITDHRDWLGDGFLGFIASGCAPTVPASSLTIAAFPCRGYVKDAGKWYGIDEIATSFTIADASPTWLAIHRDRATAVSGWTRVLASHYLFRQSATQPADPAGGLVFAKVTVAGGIITAIDDIRRTNPLSGRAILYGTDPVWDTKCDGTTDDATALNALLAAAGATGAPAIVQLPEGICTHGSTLSIPDHVTLRGVTNERTIIRSTAATKAFQVGTTGAAIQTSLTIEDMQIDGNDIGTIGVEFRNVSYVRLHRVNVTDFTTKGTDCFGCLVMKISESRIDNSVVGIDGRRDTEPANLVIIRDSVIRQNTDHAIRWNGGGMLIITGSDLEANGTSGNAATGTIKIDGMCESGEGIGLILKESWLEGNHGHSAVRINNAGFANCRNIIREVTVFAGTRDYGIYAEGANNFIMWDSVFALNAGTDDLFTAANVRGIVTGSGSTTATFTDTDVSRDPEPIQAGNRYLHADGTFTLDTENTLRIDFTGTQRIRVTTNGTEIGQTNTTPIVAHCSANPVNVTTAEILANSCGDYFTATATCAAVGDNVYAAPSETGGILTSNLTWSAAVTGSTTVTVRACNPTGSPIDTADTQDWRIDVWKH